jgi:hypothetical protein
LILQELCDPFCLQKFEVLHHAHAVTHSVTPVQTI